jgi:hypothetical protein
LENLKKKKKNIEPSQPEPMEKQDADVNGKTGCRCEKQANVIINTETLKKIQKIIHSDANNPLTKQEQHTLLEHSTIVRYKL